MPIDFENEEQKKFLRDSIKQAIDAWLDSQFARIGKWTIRGIVAMLLTALAHFAISYGGWHK